MFCNLVRLVFLGGIDPVPFRSSPGVCSWCSLYLPVVGSLNRSGPLTFMIFSLMFSKASIFFPGSSFYDLPRRRGNILGVTLTQTAGLGRRKPTCVTSTARTTHVPAGKEKTFINRCPSLGSDGHILTPTCYRLVNMPH